MKSTTSEVGGVLFIEPEVFLTFDRDNPLFSATMAARTASAGDLIAPICSTAKNRRCRFPQWRRPRIGSRGRRMFGQIEDVCHALPNCPTFKRLANGHGLDERGFAAMLGFDTEGPAWIRDAVQRRRDDDRRASHRCSCLNPADKPHLAH